METPRPSEPAAGTTATATLTVASHDLASVLNFEPGDEFPGVFATSRMIALMEVAAARLLKPFQQDGQLSVGVSVEVMHTAATPLGGRVTATAKYVGQEGKLYVFEVSAADDAGEVGRGTHKRAIISLDRLLAGAAQRAPKA